MILLKNPRSLTVSETKLLVVGSAIKHAKNIPREIALGIKGVTHGEPPSPLLVKLGHLAIFAYDTDLIVSRRINPRYQGDSIYHHQMSFFNSAERIILDFKAIINALGWYLTEVRSNPGNKLL